jgi:hypothetical protein
MNESQIDEAILLAVRPRWLKTARIISDVAKQLGLEGEDNSNAIAEHIMLLVNDGRLEAQGLIKYWRNSEVRIAECSTAKQVPKQKEWKYADSPLDVPASSMRKRPLQNNN